jgi:hypothetical protein
MLYLISLELQKRYLGLKAGKNSQKVVKTDNFTTANG